MRAAGSRGSRRRARASSRARPRRRRPEGGARRRPRFTDPTSTVSPVTPSTHQPRTSGPVSAVVSTVTDVVPACRTTRASPTPSPGRRRRRRQAAGCPAVRPGGISEGSTARPSTAAMTAPPADGHGGRTCIVVSFRRNSLGRTDQGEGYPRQAVGQSATPHPIRWCGDVTGSREAAGRRIPRCTAIRVRAVMNVVRNARTITSVPAGPTGVPHAARPPVHRRPGRAVVTTPLRPGPLRVALRPAGAAVRWRRWGRAGHGGWAG